MTGTELRERRRALRYTIRALAARWGIHVNTLSKWEHDRLPTPAWVDDALAGLTAREIARQRHSASSTLYDLTQTPTGSDAFPFGVGQSHNRTVDLRGESPMATATIERHSDTDGFRVTVLDRGDALQLVETPSLVDAVTAAGNYGVTRITVLTPDATDYPYCAGYSVPGRGAWFATADEAIHYARDCKDAARGTSVSAYRVSADGGTYYLNIQTGEEYPRGERHRS